MTREMRPSVTSARLSRLLDVLRVDGPVDGHAA